MAEAVVAFAVERLGDLLISEAKFLHGVSGEIEEIQRELKRMQCFLEEADKKQIVDKRIRNWVAEVRELAFKTEDVIETFALEIASKKPKSGFKEKLRRFACIVREGASLHKIGTQIQTIRGQLSGLTASLPTYGITKGLEEGETSNPVNLKNDRRFYPHDIDKDFVGMEKEMDQIISHLKKEGKGCEVVSICGMGGQGKTTVATQLYNHAQVKAHFEAFAWVCITQQFDRTKVLQEILKQLLPGRKEEVSSMSDQDIVYELHKFQQEKTSFIIIDDIWTLEAWNKLRSAFPIGVGKCGSKILLTTRNEKVAEVGSVYKLPGLTEEEGWQLMSKKAQLVTEDSTVRGVTAEMESIGRKMVMRCEGLPLAIATLGGMLRGKSLMEWKNINNDISFYLSRGAGLDDQSDTVTQIIGLSYDSLPPRLRQCFLCFANYKEDEKIDAEQLYLFWIAEGFISSEDKAPGEMMLNVAERYLNELAHRNLVQVHPREFYMMIWSKFGSCSVHDVIRDLCMSKVKEEKVIRIVDLQQKHDHDSDRRNDRIRRLCVHVYDSMDESSVDQNLIGYIRSLLLMKDENDLLMKDDNESNDWTKKMFGLEKFILLRVLTIQGLELSEKSLRDIEKLVYLKYLSFKGCELQELPSSIGNLRNLETLDLRVSNRGCRIPNVLGKFKQLKRLYLPDDLYSVEGKEEKLRLNGLNELELINGFHSQFCETHDLIKLSKIQVFTGKIIVDKENPDAIESTIKFINFKKLCYSSLVIKAAAEVGVCLVLILECPFIDSLEIDGRITAPPKEYDPNLFFGRLTYLKLKNCDIEEFDPMMILLEKLVNLRSLSLTTNSFTGRELVCSATGFPQLQYLFLSELPNMESWIVNEGAMPNLSFLQIWVCVKLEMLPDGLKFLTALKHLVIVGMPDAFKDRVGVRDGVEGSDFHKVRHVPSIFISSDD